MASLFDMLAPTSGFVDPRLQSRAGPGLFDMTLGGPQVQPIRGSLFDPAVMAPMPQVEAGGVAPQPAQRPGLLSRLGGAFFPTPEWMDGLLSPEALGQARRQGLLDIGLSLLANSSPQNGQNAPHALAAIGQALHAGRQGYMGGVSGALQGQQMMAQLAQQQRQQAALQAIGTPPENLTPQQRANWFLQKVPQLIASGNIDAAKAMSELARSTQDAEGSAPNLQHIDLGDKVGVMAPDGSGRLMAVYAKGAVPKTPADIGQEQRFQADQMNKIIDDYARDTKEFGQVMSGWEVLKGAVKDPTLATPFAITDAYARITNPGAVVRPTTMEMIENMGSLGQRMRKAWEHNANGALPADIMRDFQKTLYNIVQEHKHQYDQVREKAILRGKGAGVNVAPLLQDYTLTDPLAGQGAASGNDLFSKYGLTPPGGR